MPRVEQALAGLVGALLPALPDEGDLEADERRELGLQLARDILDQYGTHIRDRGNSG